MMRNPLPVGNKKIKSKKGKWTSEETKKLISLVNKFGHNWDYISSVLKTRSKLQCLHKFNNIKFRQKKGKWTREEDDKILRWVDVNGPNKWNNCAETIKDRHGVQCKERWKMVLNKKIIKTKLNEEEQIKLFHIYKKNWTSWKEIMKNFQYRTINSVKNFFHRSIKGIKTSKCYFYLFLTIIGIDFDTEYGKFF
jgi:hypothetical protein